eukprot:410791_1
MSQALWPFITSIVFIFNWFVVVVNADCSYFIPTEHHSNRTYIIGAPIAYPTDTCLKNGDINSSLLVQCTSSGYREISYNNGNCNGSPTETESYNASSAFYNTCGADSSPNDCDTATIKSTSCDNGYQYPTSIMVKIIVINKCFNVNKITNSNNGSFIARCDGGSNNGNIYMYNSSNCAGNAMETSFDFIAEILGTNCSIWQCNDNESTNNTKGNAETNAIALIIGGVSLCLLITIISVYCCRYKIIKLIKPKQIINNDYIAMQNVDNNDSVAIGK